MNEAMSALRYLFILNDYKLNQGRVTLVQEPTPQRLSIYGRFWLVEKQFFCFGLISDT